MNDASSDKNSILEDKKEMGTHAFAGRLEDRRKGGKRVQEIARSREWLAIVREKLHRTLKTERNILKGLASDERISGARVLCRAGPLVGHMCFNNLNSPSLHLLPLLYNEQH
jgi:hypothetical protein